MTSHTIPSQVADLVNRIDPGKTLVGAEDPVTHEVTVIGQVTEVAASGLSLETNTGRRFAYDRSMKHFRLDGTERHRLCIVKGATNIKVIETLVQEVQLEVAPEPHSEATEPVPTSGEEEVTDVAAAPVRRSRRILSPFEALTSGDK